MVLYTGDPTGTMSPVTLSAKFEQALVYASVVHNGQVRKGGDIPYISHLLAVASIAIEHGATEDEAIGALLHDAAEDAGGEGRIADIRSRFGDAVADLVRACSDTVVEPKPPWRKRKEDYISHLGHASASVRLVVAADKMHNLQSILRDHREVGEALWTRFNAGRADAVWFYRSVCDALRASGPSRLLDELDLLVSQLEALN